MKASERHKGYSQFHLLPNDYFSFADERPACAWFISYGLFSIHFILDNEKSSIF